MTGIAQAAVYLPRYRIQSSEIADAWGQSQMKGIDRKTVAAADEDALSMAVAAGKRCLAEWAGNPETVDLVAVATTTPPQPEDALGGHVVRALGLSSNTEASVSTGDTAAAAGALTRAFDRDRTTLILASDVPRGDPADSDQRLGAGAAAFLVSDEGPVQLVARGTYADATPGVRYRGEGTEGVESVGITGYERGAVRSAVSGAVDDCGDHWDDVSGLALHQPDGGLPYRMTGALPVDQSVIHAGMVVGSIGDVGTATVPIGIAKLLTEEGRSGACFFGGGSAAAFVFEGTLDCVPGLDSIEAGASVTYSQYLRMREYLGRKDVAGGGARVSLPNWQQSIPQRYRLEAGTCAACEALNFPPTGACQDCHERTTYERTELDPTGTVVARTVIGQGGAPPEFANQQRQSGEFIAAIVSLGDGSDTVRIPTQVVDCDPDTVESGTSVRAAFRRIFEQEGIVRYGTKFVPVTT